MIKKADFPILNRYVNDEALIYLDNAATTQRPKVVIDRLKHFYEFENANVHRGVHRLAYEATRAYEGARDSIKDFLHAQAREEIIFTKGTTQGINWLASRLGPFCLKEGDEILLSPLEHHSNLIPWQICAKNSSCKLKFLPDVVDRPYMAEEFAAAISDRTKIVAIQHISNVLGIEQDIQKLCEIAHQKGAIVVVDGAQAVPHINVNVQTLDVDFYCFSAHKVYGPTGIGVLYGKRNYLEIMEPIEYGGEMITLVEREDAYWASLPYKFEGGTPNIAGAIGLEAAINWLKDQGDFSQLQRHEQALTQRALAGLQEISGITIYGPKNKARHGVISFNFEGIHPHDLATALDQLGIASRAGHHCCQVLMRVLGVPATLRISFAAYNTLSEVEIFIEAIEEIKEYFSHGSI